MKKCDNCGCDVEIDEEYWDDREYEEKGRDVNYTIKIPLYCHDCYWEIVKPNTPKPLFNDESKEFLTLKKLLEEIGGNSDNSEMP